MIDTISSLDDSRAELAAFSREAEDVFANRLPGFANAGFSRLSRDLRSSLQKNENILDDFAGSVRRAFQGAGTSLLNSVAGNVLNSTIFRPLQTGLLNPVSQGISGFLGSLFGGARAGGGPVQTGRAFLVGERGPELFVPPQSGTIVANGGQGSGRSMPVVNVTIQASDPQAFRQSRAQIQAAVASAVRQGSSRL